MTPGQGAAPCLAPTLPCDSLLEPFSQNSSSFVQKALVLSTATASNANKVIVRVSKSASLSQNIQVSHSREERHIFTHFGEGL